MSADQFKFSFDADDSTAMKTMVLVASTDLSAVLAYLLDGVPSSEDLAQMMAEGKFGDQVIEVIATASAPSDDIPELLAGGFNETVMEGLGFDMPTITKVLETFSSTGPSSEDAFVAALASKDGWAMQDDGGNSSTGDLLVGGLMLVGGVLLLGAPDLGATKAGAVILLFGGAVKVGKALGGTGPTSSNDPEEDPDDPEAVAKKDDADDDDDKKEESASADGDETEEVASNDDKPETDEATTTPKDPTVDGSGAAGGTPPPEDDQDGGDRDPEEETFIFVVSAPSDDPEDEIVTLILTDPDKYFAELPDIDPNMIDELTQPDPDGDGHSLIFIVG